MTENVVQQLDAIHSMLSAGHRNLRIERHSLVLWGLAAGILFSLSSSIFTPEQFPQHQQRALAWLVLISVVIGCVGLADWCQTKRVKAARDEAWSFIHRQVLKVWWLLMAIGALLTFATFFFGGGYMVCAAWLVLLGVGLYVHGLFSEELLEWASAWMILIGIASLGFSLTFEAMKWISASVFGIGFPLLAAMLDRGHARPAWQRLAQSVLWILVVLTPPLLIQRYAVAAPPPDATIVPLKFYLEHPVSDRPRIVAIPAGTTIPIQMELSGDMFQNDPNAVFPIKLAKPIEILAKGGTPSGDFRFPNGEWFAARETLRISIPWIKADLSPTQGPIVRASLVVRTGRQAD